MEECLTVLEFYSGIGGTHYALMKANIKCKVVGAFDINTSANAVYKHNFPQTKLLQKNIEGVSAAYLDRFGADVWTMSPPCQPYTRQGKQEASKDSRSKSFLNILEVLKIMEKPPTYIFLENVKGFECSDTREMLISTLQSKDYLFQEFLISPSDIGIPNSRTRYYLIARANIIPFPFTCTSSILTCNNGDSKCQCGGKNMEFVKYKFCLHRELERYSMQCERFKVSAFLAPVKDNCLLNKDVLMRYHSILDIVNPDSSRSCCFTKSYGKYVEGTGSVFTEKSMDDVQNIFESVSSISGDDDKFLLLSSLGLRYFTPQEVAKLMCFPVEFNFPQETTVKQRYMLLGNSVNVKVISWLMESFLFNT